jgi:acyl-CoA synthetase (AMP-forming)/AMP-acid ligase II
LFVLARKKNIIIQGGITLYPDDVEQVVIGTGDIKQAFALGIEPKSGMGEHLFVFAEYIHSKCAEPEICHLLAIQIVKRIYNHFGLRPAGIYLLKPKSLPKTPNGKKQYFRLRSEFINRSPGLMSRILYPEIK